MQRIVTEAILSTAVPAVKGESRGKTVYVLLYKKKSARLTMDERMQSWYIRVSVRAVDGSIGQSANR
jgi:hypothetical protein